MHGPTGLYTTNPGLVTLIQGLVFPPGLILVVLSGSDLFTSNIFFFTAGLLEGRVKWHMALRSWTWSWFSNLIGSLTIVYFAHWAGILGEPGSTNSVIAFAKTLAVTKTHLPWHGAVVRGMMCNWLVCMAIWQGMAATDVIGKIFGIYLPVAYFIIGGFEHCVANQYLLYQGLVAGAPVSVDRTITHNLIPSTIGCMVGGICFVAFAS
ncbi:formate nitrite transporter [Klebsormidium nitens]|uniref:Formate nitrite transporter n=1 Tax=Klebsormidium nitens TaxID=105231 RepID=A0A1Y1IFU9_KLENI|nr:formate nitrite transporter [Klebsormidium nitens]|eukprot:GAQ89714.1 formate nitrite transporter [Klebsormidium nitens]